MVKGVVSTRLEALTLVDGLDYSKPVTIEVKVVGGKRSLSQNNLYWVWLKALADKFSEKSGPYSKEDMHDLMRHLYLGYEDRRIGNTVIGHQLSSTSDLEPGNMAEYLSKIEAWAADHGCLLPIPAHSEYEQWAKGMR